MYIENKIIILFTFAIDIHFRVDIKHIILINKI